MIYTPVKCWTKLFLDLTKHNKQQLTNRAFLVEDPEAILMCELRAKSKYDLNNQLELFLDDIKSKTLAFVSSSNEFRH